jgi:subtilisin family serine protease/subtilisin-like proprotein convertase family protein
MADRFSWFGWSVFAPATPLRKRRPHKQRHQRKFRFEPLEHRIVLAASDIVSPIWFESVAQVDRAGAVGELSAESAEVTSHLTAAGGSQSQDWIVHVDSTALGQIGSVNDTAELFESSQFDVEVLRGLGMEGQVLLRTSGAAAESVATWFAAAEWIDSFEQDAMVQLNATPNDPAYPSQLWGLTKIDAAAAWDITTGSSNVIVGVIDTGVNYNHADLAANMWMNPGETPGDGVDNDGNGFVDDVYGWDFANDDSDPMDDDDHGTHVAGTIAGVGNNGIGVVGVNWDVSIMALKFLGADGSGFTSDAVRAVNYATMMREQFGQNVRVTNNSWGGGGSSSSLVSAINNGGDAGILFAAAAGNDGVNTDTTPHYPSANNSQYIVSVAATDSNDNLASFSNFGVTTVDLAAPGVSIRSTVSNGGYANFSGTSMATPHVAGVAALAWSVAPNASVTEVIQAVYDGADPVAGLNGQVATGARLNAFNTVQALAGGEPIARDDSGTTQVNTAVTIDVLNNDSTGGSGSLSISAVTQGSNGAVAIDAGNTVTYTPTGGFTGNDSFSYTVVGSGGGQSTATVNVTVTPPQQTDTFTSNQQVSISSSGTPTVSSNLNVSGVTSTVFDVDVVIDITHTWDADLQISAIAPDGTRVLLADNRGSNGDDFSGTTFDDQASSPISAGSAPFSGSYIPEESLAAFNSATVNGTWTLEVADQANQDGGTINSWSVVITSEAAPSNAPPTAVDDSASTLQDIAVTIDVLANDSDGDGDALSVASVTQGANGAVSINGDNTVTYTPNAGHTGGDSFTYIASDGNGGTDTAAVNVTIDQAGTTYFVDADADTFVAGGSKADRNYGMNSKLYLRNGASDSSDREAYVRFDTSSVNGALQRAVLALTPSKLTGDFENLVFRVRLVDDAGDNWNENSITWNNRPTSAGAEVTFGGSQFVVGQPVEVDVTSLVNQASHANNLVTLHIDVTAAPESSRWVKFESRSHATLGPILNLTVAAAPNTAPIANDDAATTDEGVGVTIDVLANDSDADGDSLSTTDVTSPSNGAATINPDGTITYAPNTTFSGSDSFDYTISDGNGGTSTATVDVTVNAVVTVGPQLHAGILSNIGTETWTTVTLPQSYTSMVVVATPVYDSGPPITTRIQNVSGNSFQIKIQSVDGNNTVLTGSEVQYVVAEAGVYTQAEHGVTMEATTYVSTVTDGKNSWNGEQQTYANSYASPVVFGQVMTTNSAEPSMFWARGSSQGSAPTGSTLFTGKHVGEDSNRTRADETIGYIVVEAGSGSVNGVGFTAAVGAATIRSVDNGSYTYSISGVSNPASAVLTQAGMIGGNGSWSILRGSNPVNGNTLNLSIDEDQFNDTERRHRGEKVAYWVFESFGTSAADQEAAVGQSLVSESADECELSMQSGYQTEENRRERSRRAHRHLNSGAESRSLRHVARPSELSIEDRDASTVDSIFSGDWDWLF